MTAIPLLDRRRLLQLLACALALPAWADSPLPGLAVLPFDLVDDHLNPDTVQAQEGRLARAWVQLQDELSTRQLYRVVDPAPARALIERLRAQQSYLYRCTDCAAQVGKALGAELVMACWVQKVSELILNVNVEIFRVADQRSLLSKSVDMRGNQDKSWERSVSYLVRDMQEKRAADPGYGR